MPSSWHHRSRRDTREHVGLYFKAFNAWANCYTQLADTAQERNGLLTQHRKPKADAAQIATIVRGQPRNY